MHFLFVSHVSKPVYYRRVSQGHEKDAAVQEEENEPQGRAQEDNDASGKDEVCSSAAFVNTRRGKRNGAKRKMSDTESVTGSEAISRPSAAEVFL